jgi:2-keto-4-pentenoate hydratase/2-oxohepta-3-ene-1,7-dioic acid hydratase in catechol pathway
MTRFALANIATDDGDRAAIVVAARHYRLDRLSAELPRGGPIELLKAWDASIARLQSLAKSLELASGPSDAFIARPHVLAPIRFPDKLICVGATYSDHLLQFGLPAEKWVPMPFFLRPPQTSSAPAAPCVFRA